MGRWLKLSLRYKFILTLVAFTVVLSVSFGLIAVQRLNRDLETQLISRGNYIANDLLTKFWGVGSEDPSNQLNQILDQLTLFALASEDLLYVQVVKNDTIATYGKTELINKLDLGKLATPPIAYSRKRRATPDRAPYFDLIQPAATTTMIDPNTGETHILSNYVRLGLSLAAIQNQVRFEFLVISGLSALYILVGLLLAFWLYKGILGPVEALTRAVKHFKRDQTVRAQVRSGDELQTLAEEFNGMADSIAERDTRLETINQELRRANRVKSEFLAVMGHELKTPLHAIKGYSQLLLEGVDGPITPNQREDLASILASSDHLHELIDNILRFSKIESGAEQLHLEEVDVAGVIAEAVQSVKSLSRERGIEIDTATNGLRVRADGTKVKQILINLLGNAIKYTPAGTVRVSAEQVGDGVRFAVRDSGVGIPPEHAEKIFEPFTQIDSSTTRESGGIGLGLAIVKKYVEMHDGRVWVESAPGHGSVFIFTLPHSLLTAGVPEEVPAFESIDR